MCPGPSDFREESQNTVTRDLHSSTTGGIFELYGKIGRDNVKLIQIFCSLQRASSLPFGTCSVG